MYTCFTYSPLNGKEHLLDDSSTSKSRDRTDSGLISEGSMRARKWQLKLGVGSGGGTSIVEMFSSSPWSNAQVTLFGVYHPYGALPKSFRDGGCYFPSSMSGSALLRCHADQGDLTLCFSCKVHFAQIQHGSKPCFPLPLNRSFTWGNGRSRGHSLGAMGTPISKIWFRHNHYKEDH